MTKIFLQDKKMKLTESIFAYIWKSVFENNCNMYYFGEPLNILFDIGLRNYIDVRFDDLKKDSQDPAKIQYILNTHCHPDHFEGSFEFMDKDITVGMLKEEIDFIEKEGSSGLLNMMGFDVPDLNNILALKEGTWKVGDTELEIIHTPGHSPGSICVYWPEKKALVCGDLVFERSVGRTDFPGGNSELLKKSVEKISKLDIEFLLPGHMGLIKGKDEVKANFDYIMNQFFRYI
jgi:hydroxyacylglutathione hydrolase